MDYGFPDKRKTKRDKKAKMRYNKYKRGGRHRSDNIQMNNKNPPSQ